MDLRKVAIHGMIAMLCFNSWCYMLYMGGVSGEAIQPGWNQTAFEENLDFKKKVEGWNWEIQFYDIFFAISTFVGTAWDLVTAFPKIMGGFSFIPGYMVNTLYGIWLFIYFAVGLMYWIGGRDT